MIDINGYNFIPHHRTVRHHKSPKMRGGVGLLVKDTVYNAYSVKILDKTFDGILCVLFTDKQTDYTFIICTCYLPPENSPYAYPNDFFGHLLALMYMYNDVDSFYVCGDVNARIGTASDVSDIDCIPVRQPLDDISQGHNEAFLEYLNDGKLCILNGRFNPIFDNYTSTGTSVVDYIVTSQDSFNTCSDFKVLLTSDVINMFDLQNMINTRCKPPDHAIITCNIRVMHNMLYSNDDNHDNNCSNVKVVTDQASSHRRYCFNNVPCDFMNNSIWNACIQRLITECENVQNQQNEIDSLYNRFCDVLTCEMDEYLKYSDASGKCRKRLKLHKPYWTDELTDLWKDMCHKERIHRKCKGNRRQKSYKYASFINSRKVFDKLLRKTERLYHRKTISEIESVCVDDPKAFWKYIKKIGPRSNKQIPFKVYDSNGNLSSDTGTVLNTWRQEFSKLYNKPPEVTSAQSNIIEELDALEARMMLPGYVCNEHINGDITFEEVDKMINKLKTNKACGIDAIPNEVLKNVKVRQALFKMFYLFFKYSKIPSIWLKSIISPIPKSSTKDPYIPLNYRGISLLSCVAKCYSGIINKRLACYCENFNVFHDEQNGFRHDRSCTDHIYSLTSVIRNRMEIGLPTFTCFIDFQKAFDWVDRNLLFTKLLSYNIDGPLYHAIKSLYSQPESCIKINNMFTDWFSTESGVKQGDSLSPTLFSIFINDLIAEVKNVGKGVQIGDDKCSILLFADDIVIMAESEQDLQCLLDKVAEWCATWKLSVNQSKTKIMHFRKRRQSRTVNAFTFNNSELEIVSQYKYLGIMLDEYLSYDVTANLLASAAGRALGAVITKFRTYKNVGYKTFTRLFDVSVSPILEYSSGVWGFKDYIKCERVQQRAIRYFLGVHPKTPLLALAGDFGWINTQIKRQCNMMKYWNRLIEMDNERLTKKIFLYDYHNCDKNNWCSEMKMLFHSVDMNDVFDNMLMCDVDLFCKKNVELAETRWKFGVSIKPKLRTYVKFKDNLQVEEYVKFCNSRRKRSLIAQFRSGTLPLAIETGRFRGLKPEERMCEICKNGLVEDELHFLCVCSEYDVIRNRMYERVSEEYSDFNVLNTEDKFIYLLRNEWKEVCNYLDKAWDVRRNIMYNVNN